MNTLITYRKPITFFCILLTIFCLYESQKTALALGHLDLKEAQLQQEYIAHSQALYTTHSEAENLRAERARIQHPDSAGGGDSTSKLEHAPREVSSSAFSQPTN